MPSRRSEIALTPEEELKLLEDGWTLQVASIGPSGYPHLVAMWYVVIDGVIHFTTFRKSQKILNLQRNPKMSVMLEDGEIYSELRGLVIESDAELIDDVDYTAMVMGHVGAKYNRLPAPLPPSEASMKVASKRIVVKVPPKNTYSWDHRKLGGKY